MPVTITKVGDVVPQGEQVISPEVAQTVLPMLRGVTADHGTARQGHIDGYVVAGKTGTSRKAIAGGYGDDYVVSFVGVAPLSDPKLAIGVVVNEPKGDDYYGGTVAAPIFSKLCRVHYNCSMFHKTMWIIVAMLKIMRNHRLKFNVYQRFSGSLVRF